MVVGGGAVRLTETKGQREESGWGSQKRVGLCVRKAEQQNQGEI